MRKENSVFKTKFISEAGSFLKNSDYFAFVELEDCALYCIADGIDEARKQESARLAVEAVISSFQEKRKISKGALKSYIELAHKELQKETKDVRLEASIIILATDYKKVRYAQAGNARFYHLRNGRIANRSADQSLSQNLAENGEIALDKIEQHEERHNLYCYLGQPGIFKPYISKKIKLMDGDIVTLCTRGIWENTGDAELLDATEEASEPEDVCTGIEDIILSQRMKIISNYTMACVYVNKIYQNPKRKKLIKKIVAICIPIVLILVILGIIFGVKHYQKVNKISTMWERVDEGITNVSNNNMTDASDDFDRVSSTYLSFTSNKDIKNAEISTANSFCNLYKYIDEINSITDDDENKFQNTYIAYCKLLNIAKGITYVNDNKLESIDVELVDVKKLDTQYLSSTAKGLYDTLMEGYVTNFETVKEKAEASVLYTTTKTLYDAAVQDKSDYVEVAKVSGTYNFNNSDLGSNLSELEAIIGSESLSGETDFVNTAQTLLTDAKTLRYEIVAQAKEELGNEEYEKDNLDAAKDYFEQAKKSYNKAGSDTHKDEIKDLNSAISDIESKQEEDASQKKLEAANASLEEANKLYDQGSYDSAKSKYTSLLKTFESLGVDSKVTEINQSLENIQLVKDAKTYVSKADTAYSSKDYETAQYWYEKAEANYDSLSMFDEARVIAKKLAKIEDYFEEQEEKEAEEKAKAEAAEEESESSSKSSSSKSSSKSES